MLLRVDSIVTSHTVLSLKGKSMEPFPSDSFNPPQEWILKFEGNQVIYDRYTLDPTGELVTVKIKDTTQ